MGPSSSGRQRRNLPTPPLAVSASASSAEVFSYRYSSSIISFMCVPIDLRLPLKWCR